MAGDNEIKLNNGMLIPQIGLGVWQIPNHAPVANAVRWALQAGYRHIDTAKVYYNESGVGEGLRQSGVPRDKIFVTTKLWLDDQGSEKPIKAIDASLKRLGLEYVDLYLVHWPFFDERKRTQKRAETWGAMEKIYESGLARSIGVSNYTKAHLEEMKSYAKIFPAVNQVEMHPFLYQKDLAAYCAENSIQIEAYSPLAHGEKLHDSRVSAIAAKYRKTNPQILIRWSLQHGFVVLPKSAHKERIEENLQVFDFSIFEEDMTTLDNLNENFRTCWDPYGGSS